MRNLNTLAAAILSTIAFAAQAGPAGAPGTGCPAGVTPGSAGCPAFGPGQGMRGAAMLERLKAADKNADGMISREEAQASLPRLYENFDAIDANKDGFITFEEMKNARGALRAGAHERLRAADKNADGMISREEAQASLPRLYENFDAIDANKDGFITFAEMQQARQAHRAGGPGRGEGWKALDANGDGKLSREEVANAPRLLRDFDVIDTNKDGFLSAEELQAARGRFAGRGPRS